MIVDSLASSESLMERPVLDRCRGDLSITKRWFGFAVGGPEGSTPCTALSSVMD